MFGPFSTPSLPCILRFLLSLHFSHTLCDEVWTNRVVAASECGKWVGVRLGDTRTFPSNKIACFSPSREEKKQTYLVKCSILSTLPQTANKATTKPTNVWCAVVASPLLLSTVSGRPDNLGDGIDYGQQRRENLGELIMETLEAFEVNGGEDAFINIKYLVPVFQSVVVS